MKINFSFFLKLCFSRKFTIRVTDFLNLIFSVIYIILYGNINLHSTLSVVLAFFGGLLLFVAIHSNVFVLSVLFPVILMKVVFVRSMLGISVVPSNHVMLGAGIASLLTSHLTTIGFPSLRINGLRLGINETSLTSAVIELKDAYS